jgi:hypothetical protein
MIRICNAGLLKQMVHNRPLFQECSGPALSREQDSAELNQLSAAIFQSRVKSTDQQGRPAIKPVD